jgi:hypothetical protein
VPGGLLLTRARPDLQVLEARVHRVREDLGLTRRRRELLQAELSGLLKARYSLTWLHIKVQRRASRTAALQCGAAQPLRLMSARVFRQAGAALLCWEPAVVHKAHERVVNQTPVEVRLRCSLSCTWQGAESAGQRSHALLHMDLPSPGQMTNTCL